jgi:hypothetical protein
MFLLVSPTKGVIVCKGHNLEHIGSVHEQTAKGGWKWKSWKKEFIGVCCNLCLGTNGKVPKTKQDQAAAAKHYSVIVSYESDYKACTNASHVREVLNDISFQLIAPYLAEFLKANQGSKVALRWICRYCI